MGTLNPRLSNRPSYYSLSEKLSFIVMQFRSFFFQENKAPHSPEYKNIV